MNHFWRAAIGAVLVLLFIGMAAQPAMASNAPLIPEGFTPILAAPGTALYRKNYPGGSPDYVQVVDLSQGAALTPLHGAVADPRPGRGVYGGADARLRSRHLEDYWSSVSADPQAFCAVNGQFFYMKEYPTRLPYPLKVDGQMITDGYGIDQFPDKQLILAVWPGRADILPLNAATLQTTDAPHIIAGLTADAPKQKKRLTGRTFIGINDGDGDGLFETLYIFASATATQMHAEAVLQAFGAAKIMMLDGGGSTQLICGGQSYIDSERLIPQALGIVAASAERLGLAQADLLAGRQALQQANAAAAAQPAAPPATSPPAETPALAAVPPPSVETPGASAASAPLDSLALLPATAVVDDAAPPASSDPVNGAQAAGAEPMIPQADTPENKPGGNAAPAPRSAVLAAMPEISAQSRPSAANPLYGGENQIELGNALWVPAGMAPALLFVFFTIGQHSRRRMS